VHRKRRRAAWSLAISRRYVTVCLARVPSRPTWGRIVGVTISAAKVQPDKVVRRRGTVASQPRRHLWSVVGPGREDALCASSACRMSPMPLTCSMHLCVKFSSVTSWFASARLVLRRI
jgi:hypothetical protein